MNIEHLRYIVVVAKLGEISLAAQELHISQSNISQVINKLENELGITIFHRSRAGTKLTEAGKDVVEKAQEIIYSYDELITLNKENTKNLKTRIHVSTIPSISMSLLPPTLSSISSQYPQLEIEVIEEQTMKVIEHVNKGIVDLGFVGVLSSLKDNLMYKDIQFFLESEIVACVGGNTSLAKKNNVYLKELINFPILSNSKFIIESLEELGKPKFLFRSKNIEGAKLAISRGLAVGFYTKISLQSDPYVQKGSIVPISITDKDLKLSIGYLKPKTNKSFAADLFLKEMLDQVDSFV